MPQKQVLKTKKHKRQKEDLLALSMVLIQAGVLTCLATGQISATATEPNFKSQIRQKVIKGDKNMTLTKALIDTKAKSKERIPEDTRNVMEAAIEDLRKSGIEQNTVEQGSKLLNFELPDATGKTVTLDSILKNGPAVIVFYRGGWCPYCNLNLHYLQEKLDEIKAEGATLVAISPETPDNSLSTKEKNELKFTVLSDKGNQYARKLGLVFALPDNLVTIYKGFGIDLEKSNGDTSYELPLAATLIVKADGELAHKFVDADYKKRMDPEDIVKALKALKTPATK